MKEIKHIFFDLDHTLWDFEKNSALAFQQIFKEEEITLPFTNFIEVYKPINLKYWRLFREEKISKKDLRYHRLKECFDALKYKVSDDLINKIAINYIDYLPNYNYLFEGTFEILEYLKTKYKLHMITNGFQDVQLKKIKSSKLLPYFNEIITSESVNVKKPNPLIFEYALKKSKATTKNSIMIGDSIEADIFGAINFGIKAIHCNFDNETIDDSQFQSITHLSQLKEIL